MHTLPQTGVLTFLFTDIEGSTAHWDRSPDAMASALLTHDQILSETLTLHSGTIFKRVGDAFCCTFLRPLDAIAAAIDAQHKLAGQTWNAIGPLQVRIGIHTGSALSADDDYFGPALNRVARLTAVAHGGQILLSAATHTLVRADLPSGVQCVNLGSHRLRDLAEPETIYQLQAPELETTFPPLQTLDAEPNNLPLELSSFVGRDRELSELRAAVGTQRLVTLCGPGGIGKTRLALQLGAEILGDFEDGVWFVRLAPTSDPNLISQSIAAAMGIGERPGESAETTLLRYLGEKRLVLILDNAEHLLPRLAQTVRLILDRAKDVAIVVTSRESLHVRGEQIYRIGAFAESAAARLFMERAQSVVHDLALDSGSDDFAAITQALQGIPLAIELAAARVSTLSLHQIRERLGGQLAFLRSQVADDERHRTLRETIAWSYELLEKPQQTLLGKLAIFADSFTLEACEYIEPNSLDGIEALVDKSFLTVLRGAQTRYRMLEVIREYACDRTPVADLTVARARHYHFFESLAEQGAQALPHESLHVWLESVDNDLANMRAALTHGFGTQEDSLGKFLTGIWRYWLIRRTIKEGRAWLQRYIESAPENQQDVAGVLRRASAFASIEGDFARSEALARQALRVYHDMQDEAGILEALHALAVNENRRGNYAGAERLYSDIAARCAESGQRRAAVTSTANCASIKMQRGDLDPAQALLTQCLRGATELADDDILATILALHGTLAYRRGQWTVADEYFRRGLEMKRHLRNDFGVAEITAAMAAVCVKLQRLEDAARFAAEGVEIAVTLDSPSAVLNSLEVAALAAFRREDFPTARDAYALAMALRQMYSLNEKVALGREEAEHEVRQRFGDDLEELVQRLLAGDWKMTAFSIVARLREDPQLAANNSR